MKGGDALGLSPEVERSDVAEADNPSRVCPKRINFEQRKEPRAAITSTKRPNRPNVGLAETGVQNFSAVGIGPPELAISRIQPRWNDRPETRSLDRSDRGLNQLV